LNSINVNLESRTVRDLFSIATASFELARRAKEKAEKAEKWEIQHHSITGIVFAAFAIEAMINHFGSIYFPNWSESRERRKESHKKLFKKVKLPDYLGSKEYQCAEACFKLRDMLAHGKTVNETVKIKLPPDADNDTITLAALAINSEPFRESSYKLLELFINTTRQIEKNIEEHGFYPTPREREKLCECPLSCAGIRSWQAHDIGIKLK